MSLSTTIKQDMKSAMKAKDSATLSTLRLLVSAIKNKQIDLQHELSDEEIQAVVKTQIKQLRDSAESFESAGREQMAKDARAEIGVLEAYLPAQLSDEELRDIVETAVKDSGAQSKQDMGRAMGSAMKAVAGRADGNRVKEIVQQLLPIIILGAGLSLPIASHAAIELISDAQATHYLEIFLRSLRVVVIWGGIAAITMILNAGFTVATSGVRDPVRQGANKMAISGLSMAFLVAVIFSLITVAIQVIS